MPGGVRSTPGSSGCAGDAGPRRRGSTRCAPGPSDLTHVSNQMVSMSHRSQSFRVRSGRSMASASASLTDAVAVCPQTTHSNSTFTRGTEAPHRYFTISLRTACLPPCGCPHGVAVRSPPLVTTPAVGGVRLETVIDRRPRTASTIDPITLRPPRRTGRVGADGPSTARNHTRSRTAVVPRTRDRGIRYRRGAHPR